jgi:hypothetical protein
LAWTKASSKFRPSREVKISILPEIGPYPKIYIQGGSGIPMRRQGIGPDQKEFNLFGG